MATGTLSQIGREVMTILASKVRVMTSHQIAHTFFSTYQYPSQAAKRLTQKLQRQGLVRAWPTVITPIPTTSPLLVWNQEQSLPELGCLAWQNHKRWQTTDPLASVCLTSTEKANAQYGGQCREPRPRELEHDVAVTSVYLHLRGELPSVADTWTHEDSLPYQHDKRPDATIIREGSTLTLIDLLGRGYTRQKLEQIVGEHHEHQLELW